MNMATAFLLSQTIAATLFSVFLIIGIVVGLWTVFRLGRIVRKLEKLTDTAMETGGHVRDFVQTSKERLLALESALLTLKGLQVLAQRVTSVFNKRRTVKRKERSTS